MRKALLTQLAEHAPADTPWTDDQLASMARSLREGEPDAIGALVLVVSTKGSGELAVRVCRSDDDEVTVRGAFANALLSVAEELLDPAKQA